MSAGAGRFPPPPPPPHLVTQLFQKIVPEDFNTHCDLDLEDSQTFPLMIMHHLPCLVARDWKVQEMRNKHLFFNDLSPHCDLDFDLEVRNPTLPHDTPGHGGHHTGRLSGFFSWYSRCPPTPSLKYLQFFFFSKFCNSLAGASHNVVFVCLFHCLTSS